MIKRNTTLLILLLTGVTAFSQQSPEEREIQQVLNEKIEYNKTQKTIDGYKIQLYNGGESRAYQVKQKYYNTFKESAQLVYESPEWKVRVGNYRTRIEADRALESIREKFSGAIILETRIKK